MKKTVSLILIVLMLITVIPAVSIASFAAVDTKSMTQEEAYEHYKGLYYDEGHLMAFLNMHDLDTDDLAYLTDSSFATTGADARIVFGHEEGGDGLPVAHAAGTPDPGSSYNNTASYHSYIKILGGKYADYYYMIANHIGQNNPNLYDANERTPMSLTENGFINFHEYFQSQAPGVYFGAALTFDQIQMQFKGLTDPNLGELAATEFMEGKDAQMYDGTYGAMTLETVARIAYIDNDGNYTDLRKPGEAVSDYYMRLMNGHVSGINDDGSVQGWTSYMGCYRVLPDNPSRVVAFGTSSYTVLGGYKSVKNWEANSTVHTSYSTIYDEGNTATHSIYSISNYAKDDITSILTTSTGIAKKTKVRSELINAMVMQAGFRTFYIRIYDTRLTREQMARNHFADLCYYYRIENTEELVKYGKIALTDEFYSQFLKYDVGASGTSDLYIQKLVDDAIKKASSVKLETLKTNMLSSFAQINDAKIASNGAVSDIEDVIELIDQYISDANQTVPANDVASALLANAASKLGEYKDMALAEKAKIAEYNQIVDDMYNAALTAKNAGEASSDVGVVLQNKNIVDSNVEKAVVNSSSAVFASNVADTIRGYAEEQKYLANAANANASLSPENYIKFAGYQQRLVGHFGMRAVYVVNEDLINAGYLHQGEKYEILDFGFIHAYASDSIDDISVDFKTVKDGDGKVIGLSEVTSANKGANIISGAFDKRHIVNDSQLSINASVVTGSFGSIYADTLSFADAGYDDYSAEFNQAYMFRAYMIVTNGDATFVKYSDAIGRTFEDEISLYELSSAVYANGDAAIKAPSSLPSQVIHYSAIPEVAE